MGPRKAAQIFLERHPEAAAFQVTLYGSLAATGKGQHDQCCHHRDTATRSTGRNNLGTQNIPALPSQRHEIRLFGQRRQGDRPMDRIQCRRRALAEENDGASSVNTPDVYKMNSMTEILQWCERTGKSYWEYVKECEESDIWDYLQEVWKTMQAAVKRGLDSEGVLPGPLNLRRKASTYYIRASGYKASLQSRGLVFAYAGSK